jgi:hypothetical protein
MNLFHSIKALLQDPAQEPNQYSRWQLREGIRFVYQRFTNPLPQITGPELGLRPIEN